MHAAVGLPRVELSARWLRSCRVVARQNTSAFLPKSKAWPRGGFDGGIPSSWSYACDRNGAPPNPSGWCTTGAADCGRQAIGAPSISSVTRGLRRWRHVKSIRSYQIRSFEVMLACVSNDQGEQRLFSSVPVEADRQRQQLSAVLRDIGATPTTALTVLSDGAEGPRFLGETASPGPTRHVLDCWYGRRPTASIVPE